MNTSPDDDLLNRVNERLRSALEQHRNQHLHGEILCRIKTVDGTPTEVTYNSGDTERLDLSSRVAKRFPVNR